MDEEMSAKTFNDLLQRFKDDNSARHELYVYFYPRVVRYLTAKYNRQIAEDATQNFFLGLLTKPVSDRFIFYPMTYMYRCCDNCAKMLLRQQHNETPFEECERLLFDACDMAYDTEEYAELEAKIKLLDEKDQQIIKLIYWDGFSLKEVAQMLHMSCSAVRSRHYRAVKQLRDILHPDDDDDSDE